MAQFRACALGLRESYEKQRADNEALVAALLDGYRSVTQKFVNAAKRHHRKNPAEVNPADRLTTKMNS